MIIVLKFVHIQFFEYYGRSPDKRGLGLHRFEKYFNLEGFLEKSLEIKNALKSTVKSLNGLEKSMNSPIFCRC